tara:strand:+ start:767 stop:1300 length:534 start_codon:yes stop_codon:yes gene_type:complete
MKFNYLIKAIPFLSTLILIIILSLSNQKHNTRLRILIWNTPSLTLGNYLALSTTAGFILSYFITTNLAKTNQTRPKESLRYKEEENYEDIEENTDTNNKTYYDNILIERDVKDPSPTINASFRIIGRTERNKTNFINEYDDSNDFEEQYNNQQEKNEPINQSKSISSDWNDDSFSRW